MSGNLSTIELTDNNHKRQKQPVINVDELLENEVGPSGLWQWSLVILAVVSTTGAAIFPVFADSAPLRRCHMGERWEAAFSRNNLSFADIGFITGGWDAGENIESLQSGCQRFAGDWDNVTIPKKIESNQPLSSLIPQISNFTVPCPNGHIYSYMPFQYDGGVAETYHIVCENSWFIPIGTSIFLLGMMLGYFGCGFWAAKFGLRNALITFSLLELFASILSSFSHAFWLYTLLRFLVSIGNHGKLSSFNIILLELTVPRYRSAMNTAYLLGFNCISRALISALAYLLRDWRWLNLAAAAQNALAFCYFWVIPESPRWLLTRNRPLEAIDVLIRGQRINQKFRSNTCRFSARLIALRERVKLCSQDNQLMTEPKQKPASTWEIWCQLFTSKKQIKNTILSIILFFLFSTVFIGLLLYTRMVRQPVYLVSVVIAAAALPGAVIATTAYRIVEHRRCPLVCIYLITAICLCIGGVYTYTYRTEDDLAFSITLVLSIMLMATTQSMMFIYVPELYPPAMRSHGFGTSAGLGRVGSAISTYVNQLDYTIAHGVPMMIFAGFSLVAALIARGLDDTNGKEEFDPKISELEVFDDQKSVL